jgi:hypothetical protein
VPGAATAGKLTQFRWNLARSAAVVRGAPCISSAGVALAFGRRSWTRRDSAGTAALLLFHRKVG